MDIGKSLKIKLAISAFLAIAILGIFVERLTDHRVVATPREPASTERVIQACDDPECKSQVKSEKQLLPENDPVEGTIQPQ